MMRPRPLYLGRTLYYLFSMAFYLEAFTPDGETLGRIRNARNIYMTDRLNAGGTLQFVLNVTDAISMREILIGSFTEVRLYEENEDGPDFLHWAGELSITDERHGKDTGTVTVHCRDWTQLLSSLELQTDIQFNNVNEGQILFSVLQSAQDRANADYGFTDGINESTKTRIRKYFKTDNILRIFTNMTEIIDGVDFQVTPLKSVNVYDKRGVDRTVGPNNVVFVYGQNIFEFGHVRDYTSMVNHMVVVGEGGLSQEFSDPALTQQFRVRDGSAQEYDVSESGTLLGKAREHVSVYGLPLQQFLIDTEPNQPPFFKDFNIGDTIGVINNDGFIPINTKVRLYARSLRISNDGEVNMGLTVSTVL